MHPREGWTEDRRHEGLSRRGFLKQGAAAGLLEHPELVGDRDAVLVDALLTTGQGERLAVWRKRLLTAAVMTAAAVWGGETDG